MRYRKSRKELSRRKIIDVAAKAFSREGLDGISIADIMKEAGLTIGAFSWHFSSKEELIREAIREQFERSFKWRVYQENSPLDEIMRHYVNLEVEELCPTATLTAEIARRPIATRKLFNSFLAQSMKNVEDRLPSGMGKAERKATAMAILALLIGTVQISRAAKGTPISKSMIKAGLNTAVKMMKKDQPPKKI